MVPMTVEPLVRLAWTSAGSIATALAAKASALDMASSIPAVAAVLILSFITADYTTAGYLR
jgi:hypothetical protein